MHDKRATHIVVWTQRKDNLRVHVARLHSLVCHVINGTKDGGQDMLGGEDLAS